MFDFIMARAGQVWLPFSRNLLRATTLKGLYALRALGYAKVSFEKAARPGLREPCYNELNYEDINRVGPPLPDYQWCCHL